MSGNGFFGAPDICRKVLYYSFLFFIAMSVAEKGSAQSTHMMAKNLGLGGGGTAYMEGYHANFINPANLSLGNGHRPKLTIGILGTGINAGGPLVNVGVYNKYMTSGRVLNDVVDEMYDAWFGPGLTSTRSLGAVVNTVPFGAAYRMDDWTFSLAYRIRSLTDLTVNRGTMEFFTFLLDDNWFNEPKPVSFQMQLMNVSEYSAGVSRKLWEGSLNDLLPAVGNLPMQLHVGIAPKLLVGHNSFNIDFDSEVQVLEDAVIHDFQYTIQTAGEITSQLQAFYQDRQVDNRDVQFPDYINPSEEQFTASRAVGVGLDLGVTAEVDFSNVDQMNWGGAFKGRKFARLSLSMTDMGNVKMSTGAGTFTADNQFEWNGFESMLDEERLNSEFDSSRSEYINHVTDSIANQIYLNYSPQNNSEITNSLPTMLHLGTHLQLGRAGLMIDVARGLVSRGMTSKSTMAAFGLEYELFGIWPLRFGMRTGGMGSTSYSFGTGLDFKNFEFSISAMSVRNSTSNGYYLAGAFSGLVFHF